MALTSHEPKTNTQGKILEANSEAERILGFSEKVLIGKDFREFIDPIGNREVLQFVKKFKTVENLRNVKINNHPHGTKFIDLSVERENSGRKSGEHFKIFIVGDSDRTHIQNELKQCQKELRETKETLKEKNIALRELMRQVEIENQKVKESISFSIEKLLLPLLKRLRIKSKEDDLPAFELLENNVRHIAAQYDLKISILSEKLSTKEIEICNMVRSGFSSKEIASMFGVSLKTVETHRKNIRKKLSLEDRKVNLAAYLNTI